jgi:hypothetical protein
MPNCEIRNVLYDPENMEITLEALRNGDVGLNAASRGLSSSKMYREGHFDGKSYFAVEYIRVILRLGIPIVLSS